MNKQNKLATMPVRPLLYTMAVPLMLSLLLLFELFAFAATTILCGYFASGLGNGIINMVSSAIRQFVLLIPCLILLLKTVGIRYA